MVETMSCLQNELERHIQARTNRRVRELAIELRPKQVVLRGHTSTYYVKQLAQEGVLDVLPHVELANEIVVDGSV